MEQLNIVGKRSGDGFVAHKATLVNALLSVSAERVELCDITVGRRALLGYLKALGGSNAVKVVPSSGGDSVSHTTEKAIKVICGHNVGYLADSWGVGEKTPMTFCQLRVSPHNAVVPNLGASELAEALSRVLPFTAKDDARPVLQCVNIVAKGGKLTMASADGFRLAIMSLPFEIAEEAQALINRNELKGIANALARARRARVSFDGNEALGGKSLVIDTELARYKFTSTEGTFPDYEKLVPTEFNAFAHFDTQEAIKAIASLKVLADSKSYPIDLAIGSGKLTISSPDDKGQAELAVDTEGEGKVRVDGAYLADVLRASRGMIEIKLTNAYSPMLFTVDGYSVVVMPMMTTESGKQAEADKKGKQAEPVSQAVAEAEAVAKAHQAETIVKPKRKGKGKGKAHTEAETTETTEPTEAELQSIEAEQGEPVAVA